MRWKRRTDVPLRYQLTDRQERLLLEGMGVDPQNPVFKADKCYLWKKMTRTNNVGKKYRAPGVTIRHEGKRWTNSVPKLVAIHVLGLNDLYISAKVKCPCGTLGRDGTPKIYMNCCMQIVRHKCKTLSGTDSHGACCNPYHLERGTCRDNIDDKIVDGDSKSTQGSKSHLSKYTENQMKRAWSLKSQHPQKKRAEMFGVSISAIKQLDTGWTWTHVTGLQNRHKIQTLKRRKLNK